MFSAKQQKKSVSRTISTPKQKGVGQMVRDSQTSMVNRGVIQKVDDDVIKLEYMNLFTRREVTRSLDLLHLNALPPRAGWIAFSKLSSPDNTMISSAFTGCLMAAFVFLRKPMYLMYPALIDTEPRISLKGISWDQIEINTPYIGHVYTELGDNDTKAQFARLENTGLIRIEALFQPYNEDRDGDLSVKQKELNDDFVKVAGVLTRLENGTWKAGSYIEYRKRFSNLGSIDDNPEDFKLVTVPRGNKDREEIDPSTLRKETYFNMGYIGVVITGKDDPKLSHLPEKDRTEAYREYKNGLIKCGMRSAQKVKKGRPSIFMDENGNLLRNSGFYSLTEDAQKHFMEGYHSFKKTK